MNEDLLQRVTNTLKNESYTMNETWLKDCIEYFTTENNNIVYKEILKFVKTQWQLSDLREINNENGCLPKDLSHKKYTVLNGTYILQMDQMYDIATSKYKQLEQIRNVSTANIEATEDVNPPAWEPKKKRMLMLHLTDGIQDVRAIEYRAVTSLSDTLLPGYKVMITGPLKCRRGIILLEQGKFKEIGGEVESLSIANALENVLARALNFPENPDPYNDKDRLINDGKAPVALDLFEDDFEVNLEEVINIEQKNWEAQSRNEMLDATRTRENLSNERYCKRQTSVSSNDTSNKEEEHEKSAIDGLDANDELLELIDENKIVVPSALCNATNNESTDKRKENLIKPFRVLPKESKDDNMEDDVTVVTNETLTTEYKIIENCSDAYFLEDDFNFDNIDVHSLNETKDKCSDKQIIMKSNKIFPFQSNSSSKLAKHKIHKINTNQVSSSKQQINYKEEVGNKRSAMSPPSASSSKIRCVDGASNQGREQKISDFMKKKDIREEIPAKFCDFICDVLKETVEEIMFRTVRGQFLKLGKLSRKNFYWQLEGTITDKTAAIDVDVASEIMERFLGFGVKEFSQKKKLAKNNPELEHELRMACRNAEQKLKGLDALLELELKPDEKAKVVNIKPLTDQQRNIIDKRLEALKI